ncbi:MAG: threonine/serine dehydratase [Alphaproteobacteria bacterium]
MSAIPTLADIEDAARRIASVAVRTPLIEAHALGQRLGCRLFIKAEVLQRVGAFKFRGAYNKICQLDAPTRARGVVAYSSGNHAQGVAYAAAMLGAPATIVMPTDSPAIKMANTRAYGAEIVTYDRYKESREDIGQNLSSARGLALVKPYDDLDVICGQGTAGLEIAEDMARLGLTPDVFLAPCSGGGLVTGCAVALKAKFPNTLCYSAEPAGLDDMARSLAFGQRVTNNPAAKSICDALLAPTPGEITFPIAQRHLAGGVSATDEECLKAMKAAFLDLKLVVEPGGAAALAAALSGRLDVKGKCVVVMLSGGNVDPATFKRALDTD